MDGCFYSFTKKTLNSQEEKSKDSQLNKNLITISAIMSVSI